MADQRDVTCKACIDLLLLVLLALPSLILKVVGVPFKRGFFCNDESIAHPYLEDTVPIIVCGLLGICVPIISIIVIEGIQYARNPLLLKTRQSYVLFKKNIHPLLSLYYKLIGTFLFGAAISQVSTDITKYSVGRLRPHFLSVCLPDWSKFNCTNDVNMMVYIEDDVCTGHAEEIREARLSHPSGHSSFTAYTFMYLVIYLQFRFTWSGSKVARPLLQVICIYFILYVGLSRISDYKHFWTDVLAGVILGTAVAFITTFVIYPLQKHFKQSRSSSYQEHSPGTYGTAFNNPCSSTPCLYTHSSS